MFERLDRTLVYSVFSKLANGRRGSVSSALAQDGGARKPGKRGSIYVGSNQLVALPPESEEVAQAIAVWFDLGPQAGDQRIHPGFGNNVAGDAVVLFWIQVGSQFAPRADLTPVLPQIA